jgi:hypothetical protein
VAVVFVDEIDDATGVVPRRRTFRYPLCGECREHAEAVGVATDVLPDEDAR